METATKVASFVITNLPWENSDNVKSDMQVLCELAGKIMSDIKETELGNEEYIIQKGDIFPPGQQFSPDQYVPIGNFYVLENDGSGAGGCTEGTPQEDQIAWGYC